MKIDRQGLETLYADMSEYELGGIDPDKLTDEARQVFAAEVARRGITREPAPVEAARAVDTVYTAKHLFSISPALRAKRSMGILITRISFVLTCLGLLFWIFMFFAALRSNSFYTHKIEYIFWIIYASIAVYAMWRLYLWPYVVVLCINFISIIILILRDFPVFALAGPSEYILLGLTIISAVTTWEIRKDLRADKTGDRPFKPESWSATSSVVENSPNFSDNAVAREAVTVPLVAQAAPVPEAAPAWPPVVGMAAETQAAAGQAGVPPDAPQAGSCAANRRFWLIPGLVTVAAMTAIMLGVYLYPQNQHPADAPQVRPAAEAGAPGSQKDVTGASLDVNTFNLQDGISVSLPKSWVAIPSENNSYVLYAERYDIMGSIIARFQILSEKIDSLYNQEYIKNLNAKERGEFAKALAGTYIYPEWDAKINVTNRRVVDYKIIDLNGFFAVALTAKGNWGQDAFNHEVRYIIFDDHLVVAHLLWLGSEPTQLGREIAAILKSIVPGRK